MKKTITAISFLLLCLITTAPVTKTEAGWIGGDEALGGMSKALDDYYSNKAPEEEDKIVTFILELNEKKRQLEILYRIVEAEATGGTIEQKMNVASCVLARVASPEWPSTIEAVVFQKKQFSPISDGRYYTVEITESTKEAVSLVRRQGWTHSYVFFCADCESYRTGWFSTLKEFYFDGMHHYFTGEKK